MGKGGARHFAKPTTDAGLILKALKDNIGNVLDMGPYETLSRTGGCNPKGLVENADLLRSLIKIEPTAEIHPGPMKAALLKLLTDEPTLNKSQFIGTVWIAMRMERLTTILYHLRRLANDQEAERFLATRLTGSESLVLKNLIGMVEVKDSVLSARNSKSDSLDTAVVPYSEPGTPEKKKTLKKEISDVSLDEEGFPKMLESPSLEKGGGTSIDTTFQRLGSKSSVDSWEQSQQKRSLRAALGFEPNESSSSSSKKRLLEKGPLGKGTLEKSPLEPGSLDKGPLEKGNSNTSGSSKNVWFKLSKTMASKPERSYIMGTQRKGEKMRLIVEVPKSWSSQYSLVVDKLMQAIRDNNLSKEQAKDLRLELCTQYP